MKDRRIAPRRFQGIGQILRHLARQLSLVRTPAPASCRQEKLLRAMRRYEPAEGKGPFPVAILLHGCSGDLHHLAAWGRFLAGHGILTFTIDSLTPRGIGPWQARLLVCTGLRLQGRERARDLLDVLPFILADSQVDRGRISLIGWSHGAWTLMEFMLDEGADRLIRREGLSLASIILAYPYCGLASMIHDKDWTHEIPLMVVTVGHDLIVSNRSTFRFIEDLRAKGIKIAHHHIDGAGHGFDVEGNFTYSEAQMKALRAEVLGFLAKVNERVNGKTRG
jgi:dienelactone hydrolase